jgi:hypothetical protein
MELAGIRNDSESQKGGFETIGDNPRISAANILQSPFRLAAETNRPAAAGGLCSPEQRENLNFC